MRIFSQGRGKQYSKKQKAIGMLRKHCKKNLGKLNDFGP